MCAAETKKKNENGDSSRQVEAAYTLLNRNPQLFPHHFLGAVLWQLEIVDAGHHTGKIIVGSQRRFMRFSDHCKRRVQTLEACERLVRQQVKTR